MVDADKFHGVVDVINKIRHGRPFRHGILRVDLRQPARVLHAAILGQRLASGVPGFWALQHWG